MKVAKYLDSADVLLFQIIHEMRKEKNTSPTHEKNSVMKVVEPTVDQTRIEFEIERHVRSIRALIQKLRPLERQRYFEGFLSHLLSQPVNYPYKKADAKNHSNDYSSLSKHELELVRELSHKIEELYRHSGDELNN